MQESITRAEKDFMEALVGLMKEKPYSDITISELASRAGYDRKTYYRHFDSKDEVLQQYVALTFADMAGLMQEAGPMTIRSGFTAYFTFWEHHMDFLELLSKNDLLHYLDKSSDELLYEFVGRPVQPDIPETLQETTDLSRYSYYFTAGGLKNVLREWISEPAESRNPPEQVAEHLMACIAGLSWFLEAE